jgi:hypothetical protein
MKNLFTSFLILLFAAFTAQAQYSEDFESGIPAGWTTTGQWAHGNAAAHSSQYWTIPAHTQFIGINSDAAGNGTNVTGEVVTADIDLSSFTSPILSFDALFLDGDLYGGDEVATVSISTDGGTTWTELLNLEGTGNEWTGINIPISDYVGETVKLRFFYDDDNAWQWGFMFDDVLIEDGLGLDAELLSVTSRSFGLTEKDYAIKGKILNNGSTTINSIEVTYTIDGLNPVTGTIDNIDVPAFTEYKFEHPTSWVPQNEGDFIITVRISAVNGDVDQDSGNNEMDHDVTIYPNVVVPNIIDSYFGTVPEYTEIGNSSDELDAPTDLDFHPVLSLSQLWVINQRIESTGGSTVTYYDAGKGNQTSEQRVDGNAWHFMSLPTALAFGDAGDWASSAGVQDANHSGGTFTGPTLWSSDPAIYAQPSGGNGSHLDMLHGSPYSMGIAHEADNAYWVFDGWNEHIVRYDFKEDHGPGNDDHADGEVTRYTEIVVEKDGDVPSHLILDKSTGWLYVVDNGNDRVLRMDINSSTVINPNLPLINEQLAVHASMDANWEVIIDEGLDRPCGIEVMENRLLVSDYATGDIIIYDMDNGFAEIDRIITGEVGITGIKIGPEGNIWYTNRITNQVMMVAPGEPVSVDNLEEIYPISIAPNPSSGLININLPGNTNGDLFYKIMSATGQQIKEGQFINITETLDLSDFHNGMFFINIYNETHATTKKVVLNK